MCLKWPLMQKLLSSPLCLLIEQECLFFQLIPEAIRLLGTLEWSSAANESDIEDGDEEDQEDDIKEVTDTAAYDYVQAVSEIIITRAEETNAFASSILEQVEKA